MQYNPELDWMFDGNGKIDPSLLPSYVDDVLDGYIHTVDGVTAFYKNRSGSGTIEDPYVYTNPYTPAAGIIYIEISNPEKPVSYRWSGSAFFPIGSFDMQVNDPDYPASAANEGKIIQYVGISVGGGLQNGLFYKSTLVEGSYVWVQTDTVPSISTAEIEALFN